MHWPTPDTSSVSRHIGSFLCFSARDSVQEIASYLVVLPPKSSLGCGSFPDSLFLMALMVSRNADWVDSKKLLPWINMNRWVLGRKTIDAKCHFYYILSRIYTIMKIYESIDPDLTIPGWSIACQTILQNHPVFLSFGTLCKSLCAAQT